MLTKEEKVFLYDILDQTNVRGLAAKTMVVIIMGKLANEEDTVPDEVIDETGI